jgi:hypothetical protein
VDLPPAEQLAELRAAKNLSLGFLYWLQTEYPHSGGRGFAGLRLRPDLLGTADGLAKHPYIREGRRLRGLATLREEDVSRQANPGRLRGRFRPDAVAIGHYHIDIHPCPGELPLPPAATATLPFQIPLGVLMTAEPSNLLAAGKAAGTTHLTNACTRLHPTEWALGEAAGELAAHCLDLGLSPQLVQSDLALTRAFQRRLIAHGIPIYWYTNLPPQDRRFAAAQLAPFAADSLRARSETQLEYRP